MTTFFRWPRYARKCVSPVLALCCLLNLAHAQTQTEKLTSAQLQTIRALIDKTMAAHKVPGATFAIGLNGQIAWSQGFGFADIENHVKASPDTAYRTASIGKAMTATERSNWPSNTSSISTSPSRSTVLAIPRKNIP